MTISTKDNQRLTDLWHRYVKTGDHGIITAICHELELMVYMTAYKFMRDKDQARDITQEVFYKVISSRFSNGKAVESFVGWIYTITKNECLKKLNSISRALEKIEPITDDHRRTVTESSSIYPKFELQMVLSLIETLPQKHFKEIFKMTIEGKTNGEIAQELGKTEKYVRDRKSLARKVLDRLISKLL